MVYLAIGVFLGVKSSDFGLFKLYMYVQPFLAASVAIWLAGLRRRLLLAVLVPIALLGLVQLRTQHQYVYASKDPGGLRHASSAGLLPTFARISASTTEPIVTVTENPGLGKLEAANSVGRPLNFVSQNLLAVFMSPPATRANGWIARSFSFDDHGKHRNDLFYENVRSSAALSSANCMLVLPAGSQSVLNRRSFREGPADLVAEPCGGVRNVLVFMASRLGWGYYNFDARSRVGVYPVQGDLFEPGRTMSGFGAVVLFRVVRPTPAPRLAFDLTTTYIHNGSNRLPQVSIIGSHTVRLPLVGRGSARVFSAPLAPRPVAGMPYLLLDMGARAKLQPELRVGLQGLYGRSVPLDPRFLTAYVRDVSLITEAQYRSLRPPREVASFPSGLANPDLAYSGIYEDGWVGEAAYLVLAGGGPTTLVVRAEVPSIPGGQRLRISVNGTPVTSRAAPAGTLELRVPLPASASSRRIDLRWSAAPQLPEPDGRPAAALLRFVGLVSSGQR